MAAKKDNYKFNLVAKPKILYRYPKIKDMMQLLTNSVSMFWFSFHQFFVARFEAAERLEAEQAADHEQLKKAEQKKKQDADGGQDADASGLWRESESGLEWVVIPEDERGKNGRTREEEDAFGNSSDDDDDIDLLGGSQEEDENFTKGEQIFGF